MREQLSIFEIPDDTNSITSTNDEKFAVFHRNNPHVYREIVNRALNVRRGGWKKKYSMKKIIEDLRWDANIKTITRDFTLNNNFSPIYARKVMREHPELEDFFIIRRRGNE